MLHDASAGRNGLATHAASLRQRARKKMKVLPDEPTRRS
jgi:hypothetical protein